MSDLESKKEYVIERVDSLESGKAHVEEKNADATLRFMEEHAAQYSKPLTAEIEKRIRWKLYIWLVPLLMMINTVLFIDKSILSYGVLLGLFDSTHITQDQYNNLNSIFYTGYLVGQIPLHFVVQKFNFAKFVSLILLIWAILVFLTSAASNYGGLIVLRFLLGFFESILIPCCEITLLQFFTARERSLVNPVFWVSSSGPAVWIGGFISYGLLHVHHSVPSWKIFNIITGGLTLITSAWAFWLYPSNPTDARFLTTEEKVLLIEKIQRESSSSIEQKTVKKYQIIECLKDPITWLFTAFGFFSMLHNNLMFQSNLLYQSLGVSKLDTTIINVVGGAFSTVFLLSGVLVMYKFKNKSNFIILMGGIPGIIGSIGMMTIPWERKLALVAMLMLCGNTFALSFITVVGWSTSSASGYTKKFYRNILFMIGYSVANIISPQLWLGKKQKPRYYVAWSIQLSLSWIVPVIIGFVIHYILSARNKERRAYIEQHPEERFGQVVKTDENGKEIVEKVDIANLDLTDLENKLFIYPL